MVVDDGDQLYGCIIIVMSEGRDVLVGRPVGHFYSV